MTAEQRETLMADFADQKASLVQYLVAKTHAADWHAVQDAASDIRELDAQMGLLRGISVDNGKLSGA